MPVPLFPSPAPTPDNVALGQTPHTGGGPSPSPENEQAQLRKEVDEQIFRLSQELYEMEVCAGDVVAGREGAVPEYMARINQAFIDLEVLAGRMTESVPKDVIDRIDRYANPHLWTKQTLARAAGENQYALGRMLGLESFRRQLHDAISLDFPQIPLPARQELPQDKSHEALSAPHENMVMDGVLPDPALDTHTQNGQNGH